MVHIARTAREVCCFHVSGTCMNRRGQAPETNEMSSGYEDRMGS